MCTIVTLFGVRQDYPLVLATNRDELYTRPAVGPGRLLDEPRAVGGRDLEAGGTWMGVTASGFFVGVTNQPSFFTRREATLSRGTLVLDLLRLDDVSRARAHLEGVTPAAYNDFNLLFGDAASLWVAYGRAREDGVRLQPVPPGLHVLPNDVLDSVDFPKVARARALIEPHLRAPWPELEAALRVALADGHTTPQPVPHNAPAFFDEETMRKLSALCVRTPFYGSRSSTVVALEPGRCAHFLYANGPPDETPFEDVTGLFAQP